MVWVTSRPVGEADLDRGAVSGQVLCAGQGDDVRRHLGQRRLVVIDDVDAAQERLHREPAGMARAAAGGQHVVGPGDVVAQGYRRPGADEDGAGVAHPHRHRAGVPSLDFQVLGGVGVHDPQAVSDVVDEHNP